MATNPPWGGFLFLACLACPTNLASLPTCSMSSMAAGYGISRVRLRLALLFWSSSIYPYIDHLFSHTSCTLDISITISFPLRDPYFDVQPQPILQPTVLVSVLAWSYRTRFLGVLEQEPHLALVRSVSPTSSHHEWIPTCSSRQLGVLPATSVERGECSVFALKTARRRALAAPTSVLDV